MKKFIKLATSILAVIALLCTVGVTAFAVGSDVTVTSLPDKTTSRVLTIHKYSPTNPSGDNGTGLATDEDDVPEDSEALENIEFEVYKVDSTFFSSDENAADASRGTTPTAAEIASITADSSKLVGVYKTNASGVATTGTDLGTSNGKYLVVERENSAVDSPAAPFYVSVPYTNPNRTEWIYNVNVFPKNDIAAGPQIDKDVSELENKHDTYNFYDNFQWIIRTEIPEDICYQDNNNNDVYAEEYLIKDTLDTALTYVNPDDDNTAIQKVVYVADTDATAADEIELVEGTDYSFTTAVENSHTVITVELTEAGMKEVADNAELRVYFTTYINESAPMNTDIENTASLYYTNSLGHNFANDDSDPSTEDPETVDESNIPAVKLGGIAIYKYDAKDNTPLANATFELYRTALTGETADKTIDTEDGLVDVVAVQMYDSTGDDIDDVTTSNDGYAKVYGLQYNNLDGHNYQYYLVETKAPTGYNLLSRAISVDVNATSLDEGTHSVQVANSQKFILPITGGTGTVIFSVVGTLLIGAAAVILVSRKKKTIAE